MTRAAIEVRAWNAEAIIRFALAAQRFDSSVKLRWRERRVDARDDIAVLFLTPKRGEEVMLEVEGTDEEAAFHALLVRLLEVIEGLPDEILRRAGKLGFKTDSARKTKRRPGRAPDHLTDADIAGLLTAAEPLVTALDAVEEVVSAKPTRKPKSKTRGAKSGAQSSGPAIGIILGVGALPEALRNAAATVVSHRSDVLLALSGDRPPAELNSKLRQLVDRHPSSPTLIFTDMYGTSCSLAALRLRRERANVAIVFGANLPMLVRFLQYREKKSLKELVRMMRWTARHEQKAR